MTRGQCGWLLLHCSGLSPPTPCRSPGAPRHAPALLRGCERIIHREFTRFPGGKPGPIVPRHEPIPAGKLLRLLQEVPSDGEMGPGFRRESDGKIADCMFKPDFFTCSQH